MKEEHVGMFQFPPILSKVGAVSQSTPVFPQS